MPPSPPLRHLLSFRRRPLAPRFLLLPRRFSASASASALQAATPPPSSSSAARLAAAVHGSAASGDFAHAIRLTKHLVRASSSPSHRPGAAGAAAAAALASTSASPAPALGVLVIALSQMALPDEALSVFGRLRELPALPACNAILDGLVKAHMLARVWELFDEMLGRGMVPSVVTYNTLINACRHQGDVAKAWEVWDQMVARRIDPNVVRDMSTATWYG